LPEWQHEILVKKQKEAHLNSGRNCPCFGVHFNLTEAIQYSEASFTKKPIFKGENYTILLFAFQKGQRLNPHTIPIDAFVQILEGSAMVEIDGKEFEVAAGEKISLPKNLSHALTAKENFKMLLVK
jgi:quercetin dioxygenase-like cupin family protein